MQKELGLLGKDPWDGRDYKLLSVQPDSISLPVEYCLMGKMPPVNLQNWGTCTSHSVDGIKEYLDQLDYGQHIKLSQKFIYYNTKVISGLWHTEGDFLRNAVKAVCQYGACKEPTFPDEPRISWAEYIKDKPSTFAYTEAEEFKGKTYWSIPITNLRQACYRNKVPIAVGMSWFNSYNQIGSDGKLPMASGGDIGGHAISYVGWTAGKQWFRNSFGPQWGYQGYFYIPDNELNKHYFWGDGWVILDIQFNVYYKTIGLLRQLIALYQKLINQLK